MTSPTLTWIIGRGGFLGRAVAERYERDDRARIWASATPVPWSDPEAAAGHLERSLGSFLDEASRHARWQILWTAGAGVIATSPAELERETALFGVFTRSLGARLGAGRDLTSRGGFFLAGSAGGVYGASSARAPFDERSPVGALSPYGREKLAQEALVRALAERCGLAVLIGRMSNLYGPGQDPSKPQGLVTHIGRAALRRTPTSIYVPLDTIRDYLLVTDAAVLIQRGMARLERDRGEAPVVVKILASEFDTTVATVIGTWRIALKRPPRIVLARSPIASLQPSLLSFRSRIWPEIGVGATPLLIGVHSVLRSQLRELQAGVF